jgi:mannose-6-phosphate isomerase-like protein (cupin superfamily)
MQMFDLNKLAVEAAIQNQRWQEFLRVSSLSIGLYQLKVGQTDEQRPHSEDEVYVVISGKASFRAGDQVEPARAGTVIFVKRFIEHRFFDITEDLTVLVFFAPPEGSMQNGAKK